MSPSALASDADKPLTAEERFEQLLEANRAWSLLKRKEDPTYFENLCELQTPEFLWIGCADSRVPANVLAGLEPGEVFVQRNVGNQAMHTDMNCMTCIEYAVNALKVKTIIVCGHYNCGAVAASLKLPAKSPGLVNCWISDIRECRNQHMEELKALDPKEQLARMCEYNVMRQTFHVCTSPVVQNAWDNGQELHVIGVCYSLKDGLLRKMVGPIAHDTELGTHNAEVFLRNMTETLRKRAAAFASGGGSRRSTGADGISLTDGIRPELLQTGGRNRASLELEQMAYVTNTVNMLGRIAAHTNWEKEVPEPAAPPPAKA